MFAPIHGLAPDITGKGIANPFAAIWSGRSWYLFRTWVETYLLQLEIVLLKKSNKEREYNK
jgi:isocitrate dehydrogenase